MSFREMAAWGMALVMAASGAYYLKLFFALTVAGGVAPPLAAFIPYTIFVIVASIIVQTLLAILAPIGANARADERERPIIERAGYWSGLVHGTAAVLALMAFLHFSDSQLLFHMIVGGLILSQFLEYVLQIVLFRRSA